MRRTALLASAVPAALAAGSCPSGAYVIVARASGEAAGFGITGTVKDKLLALVPGSDAEAVDYPATFDNYFPSETAGVLAMRDDITQFADRCPKTPIVLMGYSQGAQVVADALVGQEDKYMPNKPPASDPIAQKYASQVACVIMMGDPSFTLNETFHVGNASTDGYFPRADVSEFATLGLNDKIQSYCDFNDKYCASGNSSIVHASYTFEYGTQAANYCAKKLSDLGVHTNGTTGSNGTSSGGSGSNSSTTCTSAQASATATATGSSGPSGATGSSSPKSSGGATPTPAASSDAAPLTDLRFMGAMAAAVVAGFYALM